MAAEPLAKRDDRLDFTFDGKSLVGEVLDVIPGAVWYGVQMEHQYIIVSNGQRYRVDESNISTPYGPWDDIQEAA